MDSRAKEICLAQIHTPGHHPPRFQLSYGMGTIMCHQEYVSSSLSSTLYETILHAKFVEYLSSTFDIPTRTLQTNIAWKPFRRARHRAQFGLFKFVSKVICNDLAVGEIMVRRKHRHSDACPVCGHTPETTIHMLTCRKASPIQEDLVYHLRIWLEAHSTDPSITTFLVEGLSQWFRHPSDPMASSSTDPTLQLAFSSQFSLGWFALLCGYVSRHLITAQALHYSSIDSKRSAVKWGADLIHQLWNMVFQLWHFRNNSLHRSQQIHHLSGMDILKACITREYYTGPSDLHSTFNGFFSMPLDSLLSKKSTYLKRWFLVIRSAREGLGIYPDDQFSSDEVLRRWVLLPPR